jgi:hypothetical protein
VISTKLCNFRYIIRNVNVVEGNKLQFAPLNNKGGQDVGKGGGELPHLPPHHF